MSDTGIDLNFGGVKPIQGGSELLPNGVYTLVISSAEVVPTKDGKGRGISIIPVVADGEFVGHTLKKDFWNIPNPDNMTPDKYTTALGFLRGKLESVYGNLPENFTVRPSDMVGRKFVVVVHQKESPGYGVQNEIKNYLPLGADASKVVVPQGVTASSNGGGSTAAAPAAPGRFKI